jgi:demethylmenaquinone methyltransferase/2-methoxy-6-polyprenyl-1,4-benzoquinol methylase
MTTAAAARGAGPLPTGEQKRQAVRQMFDAIAPRYEVVNSVLSLGLDRPWRARCLAALQLPEGSLVLDVACGTGDLSRQLARRGMRAVGIDLSAGMLSAGMLSAGVSARRPGFPAVLGDALTAPFPDGVFDGAVSGFALRNVVDLSGLFTELARLVRPGGRICLLDLGEPEQPVLRWGHHLWCSRAIPALGSLLSDAQSYRYLPRSLAYLPPAAVTVGLLEQAGFGAVLHEPLNAGIAQLFVATRRTVTTEP